MAIQWMENFRLYGTGPGIFTRMLDGLWASTGAGIGTDYRNDPDPNSNGQTLPLFYTDVLHFMRRILNTPQTTVGIAQRIWLDGLPNSPSAAGVLMHFKDSNNVSHIRLVPTPTGQLAVYRGADAAVGGNGTTFLGVTTNPCVVSGSWQHVECKVVLASTAVGSVEVRVEGVPVLNLTNIITTGPSTTNNIQIVEWGRGNPNNFAGFQVKDIVVWDGTGTMNNNFLGSVQVITLQPNADISSGWSLTGNATTSGALTGLTTDDDASYISAGQSPLPAGAITELQNLPVNVTSVRGLQPTVRARKTDGGDGNIQVSLLSGVATAAGANRPITAAYTYWYDIIERDPATTSQWLPGAVDNARFKIDRTV